MSGGSMDYLYSRVANVYFVASTPERRAFAAHLLKVSKALHDIEWVDSADYSPGDENEAIRACLSNSLILEAAIEQAREVAEVLRAELERASAATPD
jgi:hypothetical protein